MLAKELAKQGIQLEEQSLANKLYRPSLTFAFALLVMRALHVDNIEVPKL